MSRLRHAANPYTYFESPYKKCKRLHCWKCVYHMKYVGCINETRKENMTPVNSDGTCGFFKPRRKQYSKEDKQ